MCRECKKRQRVAGGFAGVLMNKRAEGSWWGGLFSLYANNLTSPLSNYRSGSASTEAFVLSVRPSPLVYRCELGTARSWRWSWYFISTYIKLGMLEWHLTRRLSGRTMTIESPSMYSRVHSTWNCSCDVLLHVLLPMLVCVCAASLPPAACCAWKIGLPHGFSATP